jgi:hypothetical protein
MVTKQARAFRLFSSGTSYDPDRLAFDQQKLRQFYLTKGYADFRVVSAVAELTPDKKDFIITYVVEEGKRYKFGDVKVDSQLREIDGDKPRQEAADEAGRLVQRQAGRGHRRQPERDRPAAWAMPLPTCSPISRGTRMTSPWASTSASRKRRASMSSGSMSTATR